MQLRNIIGFLVIILFVIGVIIVKFNKGSPMLDNTINLLLSPQAAILYGFLLGFIWTVGSAANLLNNPFSSIIFGTICGIIFAVISISLYNGFQEYLCCEWIIPAILFPSVVNALLYL